MFYPFHNPLVVKMSKMIKAGVYALILAAFVIMFKETEGIGNIHTVQYRRLTNTRSLQHILETSLVSNRLHCIALCTTWFHDNDCPIFCRCGAVNISPEDGTLKCELLDYDHYNASTIEDPSVTLYTVPPMCDSGWFYFDGVCYHFTNESKSRADNLAHCLGLAASMVEIHTQAVNSFLIGMLTTGNALADVKHYFVNAYRAPMTADYVWMGSGTKVSAGFTYWRSDEPSPCCLTGTESSGAMSKSYPHEWIDLYSSRPEFTICEKLKI